MNGKTRLEMLSAMGINVWVPRDQKYFNHFQSGLEGKNENKPDEAVPAISDPIVSSETDNKTDLQALQQEVASCEQCVLCQTRTQTVFGTGHQQAQWMMIGEAPGKSEDEQGEPFVGRAGLLLTEMIRALGLLREDVYIANILKCRPPNNRDPLPEEVMACEAYLKRQIALVQPKIILAVGRVAAQNLLKTTTSIGKLRGSVHQYENIPVVVIYHPAYLLRSLLEKRKAWDDLQMAMDLFEQL